MRPEILIVDDEEDIRFALNKMLNNEGFSVATAEDFDTASSALREKSYDVVLLDIILGKKTGIDLLGDIREMGLECQVILITGAPSIDTAAEAVRLGAYDYIRKPIRKETLLRLLNKAIGYKAVKDENLKYQQNIEAIFKSVKDAIITVDRNMIILEANSSAETICGIMKDHIGSKFGEVGRNCSLKCMEILNMTINNKVPVDSLRMESKLPRGRSRTLNFNTFPLYDKNDEFNGAVMVIKDDTRLADLESDLKEIKKYHNIVGKSEKMQKIYALIRDLADVDSTVLISGESGTGKELAAEAIHFQGIDSETESDDTLPIEDVSFAQRHMGLQSHDGRSSERP